VLLVGIHIFLPAKGLVHTVSNLTGFVVGHRRFIGIHFFLTIHGAFEFILKFCTGKGPLLGFGLGLRISSDSRRLVDIIQAPKVFTVRTRVGLVREC
jgi:hypothetical protein